MAWVELAVFGFVILMVAWVFLRPFPKDKLDSSSDQQSGSVDKSPNNLNERRNSED